MSTEVQKEIGRVLFIDIVGYSKLLIDEQRDYLHTLNEVVRRTIRSAQRMLPAN